MKPLGFKFFFQVSQTEKLIFNYQADDLGHFHLVQFRWGH